MAKDRAVYIGPSLRRLRRDLALTQAKMAEDLGISPSYIALIERNQRPLTADMLLRLAQTYDIDLTSFASDKSAENAMRLDEVLKDPLFSDIDLAPMETTDAASGYPGVAEALFRLYTAYKEGQLALADRAHTSRDALNPMTQARAFLSARKNCFPGIEDKAERLTTGIDQYASLDHYFTAKHELKIRYLPNDVMAGSVRRLDKHRQEFSLDETLDRASRRFQIALQIAYLEMGDTIEQILDGGSFESENARRLTRRALASYAAAAILLPYRDFVRAAQRCHYDLEILGRRFNASFEQIAHRLTTLQKPGQEGVPFFFIRIDQAGNISKRLDNTNFPFARHGGSCPLWRIHHAFKRPREIISQWVELPEGERFFTIARTVTAGGGRYGAPRIERVIALGCAEKHASKLVYASDNKIEDVAPTPIGVACRLCHRSDCTARAEPPLGRQILPDDFRRPLAPFSFTDG